MTIRNIVIAAVALAGMTGCQDWLDVQPKTEIKQDKMFETESGFKDALIGAYMLMTDSMTYGREMTVTFLDVLGQQYELKSSNKYYYAKSYDYSRFKSTTENIWLKNYRTIANLNALLEALEEKQAILHPTNYAIIKAEALGLRGFLHLDLLRMFGYGNCVAQPGNLQRLCIPYVTEYSKKISEQLTVQQVLDHIQKDLAVAEELLAYYGVYNQVTQDPDYELPNEDGFYDGKTRKSRFNYYAVRATQARAYMWEGKYAEALKCVELFIASNSPIPWVNPDNDIHVENKKQDLTFTREHIFYIDVNNLYQLLRQFVESYEIHSGFSVMQNYNYFYLSKTNVDLLYEAGNGTAASDIRYMAWFPESDTEQKLFKFYEPEDSESASRNRIPLIRKPEMFYIAAECYNELNQPAKAVDMINQVRVARGILYSKNLPASLTKQQIDEEIQKEWRKEYLSEGQMFFYYKRLGKMMPNTSVGTGDNVFVMPLPEKEVEIGGREE